MRKRATIKAGELITIELLEELGFEDDYDDWPGVPRFKQLFPANAKFTLKNLKRFMNGIGWIIQCIDDFVEACFTDKRRKQWDILSGNFDEDKYESLTERNEAYARMFYDFATGKK